LYKRKINTIFAVAKIPAEVYPAFVRVVGSILSFQEEV
jgi:hypothetical protein